ncbi:MAG: hypothetical protein ACPGIH_11025 [Verrucomicrobiales bacterium]
MLSNLPRLEKRKRVALILLGCFALVLVFAAAQWRPLSNSINSRRSLRHLDQAVEARDQGNHKEAFRLAMAALQLNPGNVNALRELTRMNLSHSTDQVLNLTSRFFFHPDASIEDKAFCLGVYLDTGDLRLFWNHYSSLTPAEQSRPDLLYLKAGYHAYQGEPNLAFAAISKAPADDYRFQILEASLQSVALDEMIREQGQKNLAAMIRSPEAKVANPAFRQIRSIPLEMRNLDLLKPAAEHWITTRENGTVLPTDRLIDQSIQWQYARQRTEGSDSSSIVNEVISDFGDNHPVFVGNWLLSLGLYEEANDFAASAGQALQKNDSHFNHTLYQIQLTALERAERWEAQLELLDSPPPAMDPIQLDAAKAIANKRLGKTSESQRHWREAWQQAEYLSGRRNAFLDLYRWAKEAGELEMTVKAMVAACRNPRGLLPSTSELTRFMIFLSTDQRSNDLVAVTDGIFYREAFAPALVNNALYLRELSGNLLPYGIVMGERLIQQSPETIGFHTTLILAHINREQYVEAFNIAERLTTRYKVDELPAAETIIIAGAYRKSGKKHFAAERDLERKLGELMDIERRVFEPWFED